MVGEKDERLVGTCLACGLLQTLNPPADYGTLYTEGDQYHIERAGQTPYRDRFWHDHEVGLVRLRRHLHHALRWLDVGCANGGFLAVLRHHLNAQAEGLELNPAMAAWAAERTGLPVHTSWATVQGRFDIITYHDVIEHVENPVVELERLHGYVRSGGLLVLDTPDIAAWHDPMTSHHMKPLEHLFLFTRETLNQVLVRAGWVAEAWETPIPGKLVVYARQAP